MKSNDVMTAIEEWTAWASEPENNCYDVALLKIWISFEHFLGDLFMNYAIGNASETGYYPKLKIKFQKIWDVPMIVLLELIQIQEDFHN